MKKSVIAILTTAVVLLSFLGPMLYNPTVQAADPTAWYMTVPGVLDSDYYTLYPYETDESLKIGFSKFGELINSVDNVGLEYGDVDPFAPPAGSGETTQVPKRMWVQGWFINITYRHRTLGDRNVWACAMHSDSIVYGNDWIRVDFDDDYSTTYGYEDPRNPGYLIGSSPYPGTLVYGGRKTNGTAVTDPITVLYDGPRRFVAVCTTTIYDHPIFLDDSRGSDIALVKVTITIVFNKVKKEVNLLKDVKSLLAWKEGEKMKIEFSNRGEVDLGTDATGYGSYGHFYTEGLWSKPGFPYNDTVAEGENTCYNASWTLVTTEDPEDTAYPGFSAAGPFPQTGQPATYDVAQAINLEAGYVWFAGFWPSLSDWSIDGWDEWWHSLHTGAPHYIDFRTPAEEPFIPFYIGEWDFILWHTGDTLKRLQFRGVTSYGVVDHHDADDANIDPYTYPGYGVDNIIDREVQYFLDEKFNPWDLYDAVHKDTMRWVDFFDGDGTTTTVTLTWPPINTAWDGYCSFAERVMVDYDGNGGFDPDEVLARGVDYTIDFRTGVITFVVAPPLGVDNIKVLYSTDNVYETVDMTAWGPGRYEWFVVGRDAHSVDSLGAGYVTAAFKQKNVTIGRGGMDMNYLEYDIQSVPSVMHKFGTANAWADYFDGVKVTELADSLPGDRAALKDDWCTTWAITSSNMITIGGPLINVLTGYLNDFTDAYYGTPSYAYYGTGAINALTCWGKNYYYSSDSTGYAVISTYKDINGTVVLSIWGVWGRDTYYATQWFHDNIEQLQDFPHCVTSIILEIDYDDPEHPCFDVVECLGTISETLVHEVKGGIHDP